MNAASFGLVATLLSTPCFADWMLQADQSHIYFSSVKKDTVAETHQFKTLQGSVAADGKFTVAADLASADTGIAIRNERMAQFLFETTKFTQATAKGSIDLTAVDKLAPGASQTLKVPVSFELHGKTISKETHLTIIKLTNKSVAVVTPSPIMLNAVDFDLTAGIEKLKELATLSSISPMVPVTLDLRFVNQGASKNK